ncbi:hypothetical protein [Glutamicibacter halophytocola]|uniref:hypothetical protein n=1 Tax=Glutamicibacter halophytocola TaxID=1933880 RepID=UPI0015C53CDF|nr:hypothetical protein [Glutamicibacter halophytocola]NQD39953.1 hypothetical protein [Glutamicibacter halophytocola]
MTKTSFMNTNIGKTIKAGAYIAVSAVIAFLVSATTEDPQLFGPLTALVNLLLVFVKKTYFDDKTANVGEE